MKHWILVLILIGLSISPVASQSTRYLLIPMDETQTNHLKAYGLTYYTLSKEQTLYEELTEAGSVSYYAEWLLNYRGGSFLIPYSDSFKAKASLMAVTYEIITESEKQDIFETIKSHNMDRVGLRKAPKIAVYTPSNYIPSDEEPWDDAVTLVLEYAEIPYNKIWDPEVIQDKLITEKYDWLHLHHEDFTGQYGKFYALYKKAPWYLKKVIMDKKMSEDGQFSSVQSFKGSVAHKIQEYVENGGFLFAMCSATDSLDIALAAQGVDIIESEIDGTPIDPNYQSKLVFANSFAFSNFEIFTNPNIYEYSSIDVDIDKEGLRVPDSFELFEFSAKMDPIPTMLNQNHVSVVKGFLGQTTAYYRKYIKPQMTILAESPGTDRIKYIHGNRGKGTFTFYGGHDPEDYQHFLHDPQTNLALYPNSPGYRLILNNILFPSAKKKKRIT